MNYELYFYRPELHHTNQQPAKAINSFDWGRCTQLRASRKNCRFNYTRLTSCVVWWVICGVVVSLFVVCECGVLCCVVRCGVLLCSGERSNGSQCGNRKRVLYAEVRNSCLLGLQYLKWYFWKGYSSEPKFHSSLFSLELTSVTEQNLQPLS